ncbi:DNA-binding protein [Nocardia otitidiscaviarum]|uniref:DNA-binding protein n=1 Tax=Nocardia otitidiscaviarum TaxID=1823 RepID=UPI0004A771ED|nr:DNA-binding protein [Nocardia otitidiscaviarum]
MSVHLGVEHGAKVRIRYTRAEAAHMLSISLRQLDTLRERRAIIGRRDGKQVFFDHDELLSYAKSCTPEGA